MAGLAAISLQQRTDRNGRPFPGAKAYFYEADSLLPLTVFQDYSLGIAHPNPVVADAYGVFPPIFLDEADEFYRVRITTSSGLILTDLTTLPIIGPSGGGGGSETPVDPNALFKTGDVMWLDQSGSRPGWVRDNGRTIGSTVSGASERANSDCEGLFTFLWQNFSDTICPVTGGRGASAAADWAANKPIGTPDKRGRSPIGLDTMGNSAANRFTSVPFTLGDASTAGSLGGESSHIITVDEMPQHNHGGLTGGQTADHTHTVASATFSGFTGPSEGGAVGGTSDVTRTSSGASNDHQHSIAIQGSYAPHNTTHLIVTGTFYRKL